MEAYQYLADVYDHMMYDVDYDAWAAYLHGLLQRSGSKRVYEAACGTGALTQRLYDMGYDIIASDISETMLLAAAKKSRKTGRDIRYVRQDLREIKPTRPMDAIVCACDGLNYISMDGAKSFARSAYAALKPGGMLLFDISTHHKLQNVMDGQVYFDDSDDATCIWQNRFDHAAGTLTMDVTLFIRRGTLFERLSEQHVQYAHDIEGLRCVIMDAGFSRADVMEAFTQSVVTEQTQRAQFICIR